MPPIRTNSIEASHLTSHIGFWLRYVSNHVSHAFARKLEGRGVTVAEWAVMRQLYGTETMAPSRLADELGLTRGAITKLADRLIDKKLIERTADENDGRAQTLSLTAKARRLVPELAKLADQNDAEFFSHMTTVEREDLQHLLQKIVSHHNLKSIPIS